VYNDPSRKGQEKSPGKKPSTKRRRSRASSKIIPPEPVEKSTESLVSPEESQGMEAEKRFEAKLSDNLSVAIENAKAVLKEKTNLAALSGWHMIFSGEQWIAKGRNLISVIQEKSVAEEKQKLILSYDYQGEKFSHVVDQSNLSGGHPMKGGNSVIFHPFPFENGDIRYVVVADIEIPSKRSYTTFVFFAR
jgi:hypothetical protein